MAAGYLTCKDSVRADLYVCDHISPKFFLELETFPTSFPKTVLFKRQCAKNVWERERDVPQTSILRTRFACWVTNVTDTHNTQYLLLFRRQNWLHERASILLYTNIAWYLAGRTWKDNELSGQNLNPGPSEYNSTKSIIIGQFEGLHVLNLFSSVPLKNSVALGRERTIPTERPPPVGEVSANFCG